MEFSFSQKSCFRRSRAVVRADPESPFYRAVAWREGKIGRAGEGRIASAAGHFAWGKRSSIRGIVFSGRVLSREKKGCLRPGATDRRLCCCRWGDDAHACRKRDAGVRRMRRHFTGRPVGPEIPGEARHVSPCPSRNVTMAAESASRWWCRYRRLPRSQKFPWPGPPRPSPPCGPR